MGNFGDHGSVGIGVFEMKIGPSVAPMLGDGGNCYDNAFVESFFRTLKVELVYHTRFKTRA